MRYMFFINPKAGKGKLQKKIINEINQYFEKTVATTKFLSQSIVVRQPRLLRARLR